MNTGTLLTFVFVGVLFIAIAVPLMRGMVKPNPWYGFRTPKTLNNPDLWYKVNAYSGRLFLGQGVMLALAAIILALVPGMSRGTDTAICLFLLVGGVVGSILLSFRYLQSLDE